MGHYFFKEIFKKSLSSTNLSTSFFQELSKMILKSKREARNEKDLYQKMLGHAQKLEQKQKAAPVAQNQEASKVKTARKI